MAGRGRTRAAAQAESVGSASTRRTRQASTAADEAAMAPPATRATRSTRGQSHEVESNGVASTRRSAPPVSAKETAVSASTDVGSSGEGLYTQPEEDEDEEDDEHFEDAVEGTQERDADAEADVADGAMTAKTNFRQSQPSQRYSRTSSAFGSDAFTSTPAGSQALARVLKTLLPQLFASADNLYNHLYIGLGTESWEMESRVYEDVFTSLVERYSPDNPFIDEDDILSKLGETIGDTAVALDASRVIGAANITILLCDLHQLTLENHPDNYILTALQRWDDAFPARFLPRREQNSPSWTSSDQDFALALELRTQRMLYTVETYGTESSTDDILSWMASVWFGFPNNPDSPGFLAFLKDENDITGEEDDGTMPLRAIAGLSLMDPQNNRYRARYVERIRKISSVLNSSNDLGETKSQLTEMFPFEPVMGFLSKWCHHLFDSIKNLHTRSTTRTDGRSSVALSQVAESQSESQLDPQMEMYSQPISGDGSQSINDEAPNMRLLQLTRAYEVGNRQAPAAPPSAQHPPIQPSQVISHDEAHFHSQSSSYQTESSSYPPLADMGYAPAPAPPRTQGGGAHFASSAASAAVQLGKRPRTTQDDDDFETDARVPTGRRREEIITPKPKRKRQKINKPEPDLARIAATGTPVNNLPLSPVVDFDLVALSQNARRETMNARRPKEPQTRTPWTRQDCKRLIMAVDAYKCKWSMIEAQIANGTIRMDCPRNQQALRDKARLLKQDFLKTDMQLPLSFDYVVLGKKERQAVIACGRNPDRKEDDRDEQGKPIKTIYLEDENDEVPGENEAQRERGQQAVQGGQRVDRE